MKLKLRLTYTDKSNALKEYQYTGSMPQIKTQTHFINVAIPEDTDLFKFEEIAVEETKL